MKDLYGKEFWATVLLGTALLFWLIKFLFPRPHRRIREERKMFKKAVRETVKCIQECTSSNELQLYSETPSNLFDDYYNSVGINRAIEGYNKMSKAYIVKTQQLNRNAKAN